MAFVANNSLKKQGSESDTTETSQLFPQISEIAKSPTKVQQSVMKSNFIGLETKVDDAVGSASFRLFVSEINEMLFKIYGKVKAQEEAGLLNGSLLQNFFALAADQSTNFLDAESELRWVIEAVNKLIHQPVEGLAEDQKELINVGKELLEHIAEISLIKKLRARINKIPF